MKTIVNVSDGPQKGKSTYTLAETETCLDMSNINLVFEYNMVVEDLLQKAKAFNFSCEKIDRNKLQAFRKDLLVEKIPPIPTMMVGILDVYRAQYLEGYLIWMKENNLPVRIIVDEYDVFQVGFNTERILVARDEWLRAAMKNQWADIWDFNSATNVNGMVSDMVWDEVNVIPGYEGYCGWETLQFQTLDDRHFHALLNGEITAEMGRKINRAWDSRENILINCSDKVESHNRFLEMIEGTDYRGNTKLINHTTSDTVADIPQENTCIIGGKSFGRSVSIPNLTTMAFYRKQTPSIATLLQAVGRVLGCRRSDPVLVTTPTLARAVEQGIEIEHEIIEKHLLLEHPDVRKRWLEERVRRCDDSVRIFTSKSNGYTESSFPEWQTVDKESTAGLHKADAWYSFDIPLDLWNRWEVKDDSREVNPAVWKLALERYPFLEDVQGVRDEREGVNAALRIRVAIKMYNDNAYQKYVISKSNYRKYPIMFGIQRNHPGKAFVIVWDQDVEYSANTYHHDDEGNRVKLVPKYIKQS